jgi:hypothetical protein
MNDRVAKVQTEDTGWKLITELKQVCRFNQFVLVQHAPGDGYEVTPVAAFHPLDRQAAKEQVAKFARARSV